VKLLNAIVRPPSTSFALGLTTAGEGPPDLGVALAQHEAYGRALELCGARLTRLPADSLYPDSTFVEDTAILTSRGAILTRPGAPSRAGEVDTLREPLAALVPIEGSIDAPGTVDGGDVCEAGDRFFIGISARTDERGAFQLAAILRRLGYRPTLVDIRGAPGLLHLKSGMAWLGDGRIAATDALAGAEPFREFEIVRVPAAEAYAANCVAFGGRLLIARGYPVFEETTRRLGYDVVTLEMSEFRKMDGGLSCLSLRIDGARGEHLAAPRPPCT
jgi:dimethylargininase